MIGALLTDIIAKAGIRIFIGLGIITAALAWDHSRVEKGRSQERAKIEERSKTNARKAETARRDADRLPSGRVFDKWCRDC
jgi:hypothetical protein